MSNATPAAGSTVTIPGWEEDIKGIFAPFTAQMMWRLNLGSYEDVKVNASIIAERITPPNGDMPPPPFPPLSDAQVAMFAAWIVAGCPQTRPASPVS